MLNARPLFCQQLISFAPPSVDVNTNVLFGRVLIEFAVAMAIQLLRAETMLGIIARRVTHIYTPDRLNHSFRRS